MKAALSLLILGMLAAIVWLVSLRHDGEAGAPGEEVEPRPLKLKNSKEQGRTPHLVNNLIDPSKHLDEQIEAIRALPSDLTEGEFQALMDLLYDEVPRTMEGATWSTIQNEIMEVLRQRRFKISDYPTALAGILSDKEADPIMRDYAAQHLTLYLSERASTLSTETISRSLDSLITILSGSREASQQVTGTTLMALCDLNQKEPDLLNEHRSQLSEAVQHLLNFEHHATLSNRISAIQAAGRLQLEEALPQIRQMAQSEDLKPTFKLSSIAALGYYADPTDQDFLAQLAQGQSRYRFAAQTALKKFTP